MATGGGGARVLGRMVLKSVWDTLRDICHLITPPNPIKMYLQFFVVTLLKYLKGCHQRMNSLLTE